MMSATVGPRAVEISDEAQTRKLFVEFDQAGCDVSLSDETTSKNEISRLLNQTSLAVELKEHANTITCRFDGDVKNVANGLEELVRATLDSAELASYRFKLRAFANDQYFMGLDPIRPLRFPDTADEFPVSTTRGNRFMYLFGDPFYSVLLILFVLFALPLPFLLVFAFYGLSAACIYGVIVHVPIALVMLLGGRKDIAAGKLSTLLLNSMIATTCYALTLVIGDAFYLQLIPTIFALTCAGKAFLAFWENRTWLAEDRKGELEYNAVERKKMMIGVVSVCLVAAALNELIRSSLSFESWLWYFAYFRLELYVGMMMASLPGMLPAIDRQIARQKERRQRKRTWSRKTDHR